MRCLGALIALSFASCVEPTLEPLQDGGADGGAYQCTPITCTGCCQDNRCLGGNESGACGYDGRRCRACGEETSCVAPGTCASSPSDGGALTGDRPDAGGLIDPLTGRPLEPPRQRCIFFFGTFICS